MRIAGGDPDDEIRGFRQVGLADVQQDEHRLLGQEAKATDRLLVVRVEVDVANRVTSLERFLEPPEDHLLALVGLALRRGAMASARRETLDPPVDEGEIGQDELEIELLDVACRINRPRGRRKRWVVEGTHDMDERVRLPQAGEMLGRQLLRSDVALAGCGWRGQVDVGDVGVDDLLGLEDLGQLAEPVVRHLDDADVELHAAEAAGFGVPSRQRVEDGRLACAGKTHDRSLHRSRVPTTGAGESGCGQYPASGSTTLSSGSPAANRRRLSQNNSTLRSRTRALDHDVCGVTMAFGKS